MEKQKCALCSHCTVIIKAENEIPRPIAVDDIRHNNIMFIDYCIQKYTNPGKTKKYITCPKWKSLFPLNFVQAREMQRCNEFDPDILDCDDNPIDINQYFSELARKELIDTKGFKEKYQK